MNTFKYTVIFGAGHGIGFAIVKELLDSTDYRICATFHNKEKANELIKLTESFTDRLHIFQLNPLEEKNIADLKTKVCSITSNITLFINCIGFLHNDNVKPEKGLRDINYDSLDTVFQINSFITPMLAKYFESFISKNLPSVFATISAKVGSIEDNNIGGWYAYRASKAALNMFLKNISIEWKRKKLPCSVLAIHPGTTRTELSSPYIKNTPYKLHTPTQTAKNILNVINKTTVEQSGSFISWDQQNIPW